MSYNYEFICDQDRFNLLPYLREIRVAFLATVPLKIMWNRDGVVREIPRAVLRNMLQLHDDYTALVNTGRILFVPEPSYTVEWETVDPTPEKSHA